MEKKTINLNELISSKDFSTLDVVDLMKIEGGKDSLQICEGTSMCSGGGGITCLNSPSFGCNGSSLC